MNQPKFKFGETVFSKFTSQFSVTGIQYRANSNPAQYYYHSYPQGWIAESELELYQEPKKKKLYAYRLLSNMVIFKSEECKDSADRRALEYDIEYPSEEVK